MTILYSLVYFSNSLDNFENLEKIANQKEKLNDTSPLLIDKYHINFNNYEILKNINIKKNYFSELNSQYKLGKF